MDVYRGKDDVDHENDNDDDDDDVVEMASALFEQGKYVEGRAVLLKELNGILRDYRNNDEDDHVIPLVLAYELYSLCCEHDGVPVDMVEDARQRVESARAAVTEKELTQQRDAMNALEMQGDQCLALGSNEDALDALEDCLNLQRALFRQPEPATMVRLLNKCAIALHRLDNHEESKERLEEALALAKSQPEIHDSLQKLWRVYGNLQMFAEGERALVRLCEMECPLPCRHKQELGEYLHRMGNLDKALEVFESMENTALTLAMMARVLLDKQRTDEALKVLGAAMESPSRNEESQLIVGQAFRRLCRPEDALRIYESITPASARSLHGKGLCFLAQKKFDDALMILMEARSLAEDDFEIEIIDDIGAVYHALGDDEKALEYYLVAHPNEQEVEGDDGEDNEK